MGSQQKLEMKTNDKKEWIVTVEEGFNRLLKIKCGQQG
jgi:hypothetical protein